MKKFTRTIDLKDNAQVLLICYYDPNDDTHYLRICTLYDGFLAEMNIGFNCSDAAYKVMNAYNEEAAYKFRDELLQMVDEDE